MTNKSAEINEIAAALIKAQAEMPAALKDGLNPHLKNKYASLSSLWEVARPILKTHGLALIQTFDCNNIDKPTIITTLMHTSGQFIEGALPMPVAKQNDPQAVGSAITYGRRYSMAAMLGIVADEDDDAESAKNRGNKNNAKDTLPPNPGKTDAPNTNNGNGNASLAPEALLKALNTNLSKVCKDDAHRMALLNEWLTEDSQPPISSTKELTKELAQKYTKKANDFANELKGQNNA